MRRTGRLAKIFPAFFVFLATMATAVPVQAGAAGHGLSAFGDLKYGPAFSHFDYADPGAIKGGRLVTVGVSSVNTFDSLNGFILKGNAAQKLDLLFDSLMVRAFDEPDAVYGLAAKTAHVARDGMSVVFTLRPEARFADNSRLLARDVAESFRLLKTHGHPRYRLQLRDVVDCEALDEHRVRYRFTGAQTRDLPMLVAQLPIVSRAYYARHDFTKTTLTPPLGSGPYRVKHAEPGQFIAYERRADYWARDLPVNRGHHNFDEIRLVYFRDQTAAFEALKSGELDLREEFSSKAWATAYELESVKDKKLITEEMSDGRMSGMQGFFINMRRDKFKDRRVRQALDYAFDFEWTRANLFYGQYQRTVSFFENSDMKALGAPGAGELTVLDPFRDRLAPEVFALPYTPPVNDGSGHNRQRLRQASQLLSQAGWHLKDNKRRNAQDDTLSVEFLTNNPAFERILGPYIKTLRRIGVDAGIRFVEPAQYQERLKRFEFDITGARFVVSATPGVALRNLFSARAADAPGSYNISGVKNPVVDALIEQMIQSPNRPDLVTTARALDRVLRAENLWISNWHHPGYRLAYWDVFSRPAVAPRYARGIFSTWWINPEKRAGLTGMKQAE